MTDPRTVAVQLTLVILGCHAGTAPPTFAGSDHESIREAVFRQQMRQFLEGMGEQRVICLAVREGATTRDPSASLMRRFAGLDVRKVSDCKPDPRGAIELKRRRPAVILTAGPITWVRHDEVDVKATYFKHELAVAAPTYRVVCDRGRWISLGPILQIDVA
jgi:hypothetical protein